MKWLLLLLFVTAASASWEAPQEQWTLFATGPIQPAGDGFMVGNAYVHEGETKFLPDGSLVGGGILANGQLHSPTGWIPSALAGEIRSQDLVQNGNTWHQVKDGFLKKTLQAQSCSGTPNHESGTSSNTHMATWNQSSASLYAHRFSWSKETQNLDRIILGEQAYLIHQNGSIDAFALEGQCNPNRIWNQTGAPVTKAAATNQLYVASANPLLGENGHEVRAYNQEGVLLWTQAAPLLDLQATESIVALIGSQETLLLDPATGWIQSRISQQAEHGFLGDVLILSGEVTTAYGETKPHFPTPEDPIDVDGGGDVVTIPTLFLAPFLLLLRRWLP